jgi:hypothetical protein
MSAEIRNISIDNGAAAPSGEIEKPFSIGAAALSDEI